MSAIPIPARVVVFVRGGVVSDVVTEFPGVEVLIVDYDNEECGESGSGGLEAVRIDRKRVEEVFHDCGWGEVT